MELKSNIGFAFESIPDAPEGLSAAALKYWHQIIPIIFDQQTGRPADISAITMLCELRADLDAMQIAIREDGFTTESAAGSKKSHPALRSLEACHNRTENLMRQFGLMPSPYKVRSYADHVADVERSNQQEDEYEY